MPCTINLSVAITVVLIVLPIRAAFADSNAYQLTQPLEVAQTSTQQQKRSQPEPLALEEPQHVALTLGGLYTHRKGETAGWAPSLQVDYSVADRLQLHAMMPFAFDRLSGGPTHYGPGDFETGIRYRFIDDDPAGWRPAVATYPLLDFPTGSLRENLGTGRTHAFLPLWFSKTLGAWIPYGGGGYWINPGPDNRNWGFVALGAIRVIDETWSLTGEVFHATSSKVGIKSQTGFDVGTRVNINPKHHVVFAVGRGLQNAADTNEFTAYLAYILTF